MTAVTVVSDTAAEAILRHQMGERHLAVVPAWNESATIAGVVEQLHREAPECDVLVVDDGSTDDTRTIAAQAGARVLRMPFNVGIGGAVQAGFVFALENGYDTMVQVDGDGQHDPTEVETLRVVMRDDPHGRRGLRLALPRQRSEYPAPISRRTGIHLFAFVLSRLVDGRVSDPTSGFRLYNRRAIGLFARDYPHDYPEVEAVLMLHHHQLRMREVPVRMFERGGGARRSRLGQVRVLHDQGAARPVHRTARRRPVPETGGPAPVTAGAGL